MKVSVIIPIYNVEAYVEECIESVRNQTLEDIEIICIHDHGTDGSFEIVKKLAQQDSRIRLYENEENIGLASTRNRGIQLARGTYLYFLDSDDKIREDTLEKLYEKAQRLQLDAIVFGCQFIYDNEELEEKFHTNPSCFKAQYPEVISGKQLYQEWMRVWDWMPSQPRFFYNREFLIEHNITFIDGLLHEDESFAYDVLMHAKAIHVENEPYFIRRFRADSIMTKNPTMKNVIGCVKILQHIAASEDMKTEDAAFKSAVNFYRKKITTNVKNKFLNAGFTGAFYIGEEVPFLSVIIPVYNVADYLAECLESVLAQDFMDYEIICVDDCSTDLSYDLLLEYEKLDPRVRVYQNEQNMGQAYTRNVGLSHARGTYVYMMDADDYIIADSFSCLCSLCKEQELTAIAFENRQFTEDKDFEKIAEIPLFTYKNVEGIYSGKEAFITCVKQDLLSPSVPTYMIKREYMEKKKLRFREGILHEDIGFIFQMFMGLERIQLLSKPLYCRRFRPASTVTGGFGAKNAEGYLRSWQEALKGASAELEEYKKDEEFLSAYRKWIRDVLGRIRVLYLQHESDIYHQEGGFVDEESRLLLEMLKETTTGICRAQEILGQDMVNQLEQTGSVYICGFGQYANRMLDVIGALDVQIKGLIVSSRQVTDKKAYRGFPVLIPEDITDKDSIVVLAMSHYNESEYVEVLKKTGFTNLVKVNF